MEKNPEVWQRGPIDGVPALLQPVVHALLQAVEDVENEMNRFPRELLFEKPGGVASIAFHLRHLTGVLDRLFTYARGGKLSEEQLLYLQGESAAQGDESISQLVDRFRAQVDSAIGEMKAADIHALTDPRLVGRKQISSTVIGLWFHAAEHTQRHVGQLIVTARVLKGPSYSR